VTARSVKYLGNLASSFSDQETRDNWWLELRSEIRNHARILCCFCYSVPGDCLSLISHFVYPIILPFQKSNTPYTMNSTLLFRKTSINTTNTLMTMMVRQYNKCLPTSTAKSTIKGMVLQATMTMMMTTVLSPPLPLTLPPIVSIGRSYHSSNATWQQQQQQRQPPSKDVNDDKTNDQQDDVKEEDTQTSTTQQQQQQQQQQQPHGTATISFVETDEAYPFTNNNDDDVDTNTKHPIASLKGNGDPSAYTVPIVVKMPDMSSDDDPDHQNIIEKWYKQPGDVIKRNDILCDITTPAFTFGMVTEDEEDAIMGNIHVAEGDAAADHTPICTIYHLPDDHVDATKEEENKEKKKNNVNNKKKVDEED
jgi:hypothetical protein